MENKVNEVLNVSMEKIKQMVDVSTVVGDQIRVSDELTVIPISKVSYGFAGGGSDLPSKNTSGLFGGGSGAGVSITPIAMLVVQKNDVRLLPVAAKPGSADQIINMVPDVINKISGLVHKDKDKADREDKVE
ncbi:MAG: GerW family sporulation protein [Clostridia bacterium]|nr:GerW family sporulation protein [Clostridia bacterium]